MNGRTNATDDMYDNDDDDGIAFEDHSTRLRLIG